MFNTQIIEENQTLNSYHLNLLILLKNDSWLNRKISALICFSKSVRAGYVRRPQHCKYSYATNYMEMEYLLENVHRLNPPVNFENGICQRFSQDYKSSDAQCHNRSTEDF